jgi:uncharacterized repeat protein (TIGR03847 family)
VTRQVFLYDPPDRFVAGTVGEPGQRTFFLQARGEGRITSVALEKQQVQLLAEQVGRLLEEVRKVSGADPVAAAPIAAEVEGDLAPLDLPIEEDFRVATLALGWDPRIDRVVIVAQAQGEESESAPAIDDEDLAGDGPDVLRVRLTAAMAHEFAGRAAAVVAAGRPPCPLCALPLDHAGHVFPRQNGYRR